MYTMLYSTQIWSTVYKYGAQHATPILASFKFFKKGLLGWWLMKTKFLLIPGPLPASSPLFAKLRLLKLKDIFSLQVSIFIHKCLYLPISDNFNEWFILNHSKHNYTTRHNYNNPSNKDSTNSLFIPLARTSNFGLKC